MLREQLARVACVRKVMVGIMGLSMGEGKRAQGILAEFNSASKRQNDTVLRRHGARLCVQVQAVTRLCNPPSHAGGSR